MITADQLTARYSRALALTLCQELHATEAFADFCIRYMRHPDPLVARNALCVLTKAGSRDLLQLQPLTDDLILLAISHRSCANSGAPWRPWTLPSIFPLCKASAQES